MPEVIYKICMSTPLGKKKGTMGVGKKGNKLKGWLNILEHREPFEGKIDDMGNCRISGVFNTLIRTVPYIATGQISDSFVHLQIQGKRNVFDLSGIVSTESEEQ